ncbi:MAG: CRTAC1 family protein [Anaerolineae bacterium]
MKKIFVGFALAILLVVWGWSGLRAQGSDMPFVDVTAASGITAPVRQGTEKITGQTWADYDQDGWLDFYVTDTDGANVLYRNNGDGTFAISPLSASVALSDALSGGALFADYDNDGWPDLYVVNWGQNVLFHNENGRAFIDVTQTAGVGDDQNGKSAAWGDYDQDGWLDLYVVNWACYPQCGRPSEGDRDRLYHNNGDGAFTEVTDLLGNKTRGAGFVASFVDYDNDGDADIYLVNDEFINPIGNVLWRNDGPGCDGWCFTIVSEEAKADTQVMGMGLATADYDNDGRLDFYFSNAGPMTLLRNQGGQFADVAADAGVQFPQGVAWGAVFLDYDNDGWQDLYLAVSDPADGKSDVRNPLFRNNGDGTFVDVGQASGAADPGHSIGVAAADYDRDGRVDLLVGNFDEGYHLYRNQSAGGHWIGFHLQGGEGVNRDGIGARVTVTTPDGRTQTQEVICGSGVGGSSMLDLHFGLGEADVADVSVSWPNGQTETAVKLAADQTHTLASGQVAALPSAGFQHWPELALFLILLVGLFLVRKAAFN